MGNLLSRWLCLRFSFMVTLIKPLHYAAAAGTTVSWGFKFSMIVTDRPGWVTKISKWSERNEIFLFIDNFSIYYKTIFIVDFESELRIDKNFVI